MKIHGVIFDFNGTLFWDTQYHNKAWDIYFEKRNRQMSDQDKDVYIHGKTNKAIFEYLEDRLLSVEELNAFIEEKESIYRDICLKQGMGLAPGAIDLLNYLKRLSIPFTIATASGWSNVKFFFDKLHLNQWFSIDGVVYDNGTFKGKPAPDIFLIAAGKLSVPIDQCAVFEDSPSGLKAAANAKAGEVFCVKSVQYVSPDVKAKIITNFNQVDLDMFSSIPKQNFA